MIMLKVTSLEPWIVMQDEKNGRKQDVAISRKQIDASVRYHVLKRYS